MHDDAQHLLVVLVVAERLDVGLEERHVVRAREGLRELVDVDGLVVLVDVGVLELLAGHERNDVVVLVDLDDGAVHPALVLVHERERGARVLHEVAQDAVLGEDDDAGVDAELVLDAGGEDEGTQLLGLVAVDDDDAPEPELVKLGERSLDERHAVDLDHALGVAGGERLQALAHACCEDDRLHAVPPISPSRTVYIQLQAHRASAPDSPPSEEHSLRCMPNLPLALVHDHQRGPHHR